MSWMVGRNRNRLSHILTMQTIVHATTNKTKQSNRQISNNLSFKYISGAVVAEVYGCGVVMKNKIPWKFNLCVMIGLIKFEVMS